MQRTALLSRVGSLVGLVGSLALGAIGCGGSSSNAPAAAPLRAPEPAPPPPPIATPVPAPRPVDAPPAPAPGPPRAACASLECVVRVSADGLFVATTDGERALVLELASGATTEIPVKAGERLVDVSATHKLALVRGGKAFAVRGPSGDDARLTSALAAATSASFSEDGQRLVVTSAPSASPEDKPCPTTWIAVPNGALHAIHLPPVAAGGSEPSCPRARRRSVEIFQSRIAVAFADYVKPRRPNQGKPDYVLGNDFGTDRQPQARFFGADVDARTATVAVAHVPTQGKNAGKPIIEVLQIQPGKSTLLSAWPITGTFKAMWLSPEGSRLIVRTAEAGPSSLSVFDTAAGVELKKLDFEWDGFEFLPDGKKLAVARGGELRVVDLP